MIVCLCTATDDAAVEAAIRDGADCLDSIAEATGAGSGCGGCRVVIAEILAEKRRRRPLPMLSPGLEPAPA